MTNRQLLCAVTLVVGAASIGCRNSAKTTQSTSTPSPTAPAQPREPMPTTAPPQLTGKMPSPGKHVDQPPDLATMVPVKPFQLKPPAAFTADQLPDEAVEFRFAGKAGQMLRVRVGTYRVRIQPPGGGATLEHGWDLAGNWFMNFQKPARIACCTPHGRPNRALNSNFFPTTTQWSTRVSNQRICPSISANLRKTRNS